MNEKIKKWKCQPRRGPKYDKNGVVTYQDKPPKMRFHPGQFFRPVGKDTLWEIVFAYRLMENPHEWVYVLEERETLQSPQSLLSLYCEANSKSPQKIQFKLFATAFDALCYLTGRYSYGDQISVSNKDMIHRYIKVSNGNFLANELK